MLYTWVNNNVHQLHFNKNKFISENPGGDLPPGIK